MLWTRVVIGTSLVVSPILVCGTWYAAWLYADSQGAPGGDTFFAWAPFFMFFLAAIAGIVCVILAIVVAVLASTGRVTVRPLRALTAVGTAVVVVQVALSQGSSLILAGGREGFPKTPGVILALVVGVAVSALPLAAAWVMLSRADDAPAASAD